MARGKPFSKGKDDRRGGGRPPGALNKKTRAVNAFITELAEDVEVQQAFRDQILAGDRGSMAAYLGVVAHKVGKPRETVQIDTTPNMARLIQLAIAKADERAAAKAKDKEKAS